MKLKDRTEYCIEVFIQCGLMRPVDAADYMGVTRNNFRRNYHPKLRVFEFKGKVFYSFLDVFELQLTISRKVNKAQLEKLRDDRKVEQVQRLDAIKHKLQK